MLYKFRTHISTTEGYELTLKMFDDDSVSLMHHTIYASQILLLDLNLNTEEIVQEVYAQLAKISFNADFDEWMQSCEYSPVQLDWTVFMDQAALKPIAVLGLIFENKSHFMLFKLRWL